MLILAFVVISTGRLLCSCDRELELYQATGGFIVLINQNQQTSLLVLVSSGHSFASSALYWSDSFTLACNL